MLEVLIHSLRAGVDIVTSVLPSHLASSSRALPPLMHTGVEPLHLPASWVSSSLSAGHAGVVMLLLTLPCLRHMLPSHPRALNPSWCPGLETEANQRAASKRQETQLCEHQLLPRATPARACSVSLPTSLWFLFVPSVFLYQILSASAFFCIIFAWYSFIFKLFPFFCGKNIF